MGKARTDRQMIVIRSNAELPDATTKESLTRFLHESLKPYEDDPEDIHRAMTLVLDSPPDQGGFVVLARDGSTSLGAAVVHYTPWSGYVPANLLLFVAVAPNHRRRGLGRALIERAIEECEGDMKLHVEHDNPAKRLYERLGFTSKYAEMRYSR
ncbi:MAG: N-acetyltransferase [Candidatus Atribacteria bacterium]|nr:MAG: N-acetyltransferase [Candidatus Atribacteria bacterium]